MLRMTLRQLEAFYWTGTLGTVAAAAKQLHVSQPAITARVKELEDVLGVALLSRSQQGVQLTPTGHRFLGQTQQLLQLGASMEGDARQDALPLDGLLRIGADETAAAIGVAEMVRQLRVRYPALRIDLSVERSKVLSEKLNRRELDIALHTSPMARPHVVDRYLGRVQVAWVAGAGMELANLPFSPADARSMPLVINPQPSVLHFVAREWLGDSGAELHQLNTCNSLSLIVAMVREGHVVAALPVPVVLEHLKLGSLKLVESSPPLSALRYYVSFLAEKQPAGVDAIVKLAEQVLRQAQFFEPEQNATGTPIEP